MHGRRHRFASGCGGCQGAAILLYIFKETAIISDSWMASLMVFQGGKE